MKLLLEIENKLRILNDTKGPLYFLVSYRDRIKKLEGESNSILKAHEEDIRHKSEATWISAGDKSTKYFHRQFNLGKQHNSIWNI